MDYYCYCCCCYDCYSRLDRLRTSQERTRWVIDVHHLISKIRFTTIGDRIPLFAAFLTRNLSMVVLFLSVAYTHTHVQICLCAVCLFCSWNNNNVCVCVCVKNRWMFFYSLGKSNANNIPPAVINQPDDAEQQWSFDRSFLHLSHFHHYCSERSNTSSKSDHVKWTRSLFFLSPSPILRSSAICVCQGGKIHIHVCVCVYVYVCA